MSESENKCGHCKRKVVEPVSCVECGNHFHLSCSNKANAVGPDGVIVCCKPPQLTSETDQLFGRLSRLFQEKFDGFKRDIEEKYLGKIVELREEINIMAGTLAVQEEKISSLQRTVAALESNIGPSECIENTFSAEEFYTELDERKLRAKNVMFHGVPVDRSKQDSKKVIQDIISKVFSEIKVIRTMRVDRKRDEDLMSVKVVLRDSEDALKILRNKNKFGQIRVKADLTVKQRDYMSQLHRELESRKSNGEKDITIRYIRGTPKIVPLSKNRRPPTDERLEH